MGGKFICEEASEFQLCPFGTKRPECSSEMGNSEGNICYKRRKDEKIKTLK